MSPSPRARMADRSEQLIHRAAKKLARLSAEFTDEDGAAAIETLRNQLTATKPIWDVVAKSMTEIPDEKVRFDAAVMILAYLKGRPVERQVSVTADVKDFTKMVDELAASSPAFQAIECRSVPPEKNS